MPAACGKENNPVRLHTDLGPDPSAGSNELEFGVVIVQNAAARLLTVTEKRDPITPILLYLPFPPDDHTALARISDCLSDISTWMKALHLQLNRSKTELLVFPAKPTIHHSICIQTESLSLAPSKLARNLGVMIDDQLTFKDHVTSVARSCRFALLKIRKIRPYLTQHTTQLLVQAMLISRLDYCNALLTALPACAVKPLQMVQNAEAPLVFGQPKRSHVTPLFVELHWLPLAARIKSSSHCRLL
ncbi:uncharacterized protein LOC142399254 [Odontesthes bonariensis]|uniref:uncharacterized protein LOC142399254 n=1 Tax=Odontesthes bonariensis TaxID=219752 RepID=UPI003F58852A